MRIQLADIKSSPAPVRTTWDEDKLNELAQSLLEQGQIVPIKVRPNGVGFEIVYGHRRVEASRRAGLFDIEATVEITDDTNTLIQALIENLQREDMTPMDTARGLKALVEKTQWSLHDIERQGIMTRNYAGSLLALLEQPKAIQDLLEQGELSSPPSITEAHVRQTRRVIEDPTLKVAVLQKAASEGLTAEQTRRVAESVAAAPSPHAKGWLIEREYDPSLHRPAFIKERAEHFGANDPLYRSPQTEQVLPTFEWDKAPEVISIIDTMKGWDSALRSFRKASDMGKLSPEARHWIARRVRHFVSALNEWADNLEGSE